MSSNEGGVHLCVFIHGLWGNPNHLDFFSKSLREKFPDESSLYILVAKSNSGSFTYDGIELGGERVTQEIENEVHELEKDGKTVTKFSAIGYSLGGLIARYAVGLLFSKDFFNKIEPINFITFATPHLGVRTPLLGFNNQLWNALGSRTLSTSGRQLWTIDLFRDTGRPILSLLADPNSIFLRGLALFRRRSLYANIINDRSVPFYTAFISRTDPFADLSAVHINYAPGYSDVILSSKLPASPRQLPPTIAESITTTSRAVFNKAPLFLAFAFLLPIASVGYFLNAGYQTFQSARRIRAHEEGRAGLDFGAYRLPVMVETIRRRASSAVQQMHAAQEEEFLPANGSAVDDADEDVAVLDGDEKLNGHAQTSQAVVKRSEFPTLALTPEQFAMIDALDAVGFEKFPVHIKAARHSHAAMIVRRPRESFYEGKEVAKHWTERFEL